MGCYPVLTQRTRNIQHLIDIVRPFAHRVRAFLLFDANLPLGNLLVLGEYKQETVCESVGYIFLSEDLVKEISLDATDQVNAWVRNADRKHLRLTDSLQLLSTIGREQIFYQIALRAVSLDGVE